MRPILLIATILLIPTIAAAQDASAVITGSTGGVPGDVIILDASESVADSYDWRAHPLLPDDIPTIVPIEGGRRCIVSTRLGTRNVFLAVAKDGTVDTALWTVRISRDPNPGPEPEPEPPGPDPDPDPPGPGPDPEPKPPVIPDGKFSISKIAYQYAMAVDSPNRAVECKMLCGGLEGVAAAIAAGVLTKDQDILKAVLESNNNALGGSMSKWVGWGAAVAEQIKTVYSTGLLRTPADWGACILEVVIGLKAVK